MAGYLNCPHCGASLFDDGTLAGQECECPHCRGRMMFPGQSPAMREVVCLSCGATLLDDGSLGACPHCGQNPSRPTRSQRLAAAKAHARSPKRKKGQPAAIGAIVTLVVIVSPCLFCGLGGLLPGTTGPASRRPTAAAPTTKPARESAGDRYAVTVEECFAGVTYEDLSECSRLCARQDDSGVMLMIADGRIVVLPDRVKARVVEAGILADRVRIEEGAYANREFWVAPEFVHAR